MLSFPLRTPPSRKKLGQIVELQEQLQSMRDDLKTTHARGICQLKKQEDRIDASRAHIETVNREVDVVEAELSDLISNLTFES